MTHDSKDSPCAHPRLGETYPETCLDCGVKVDAAEMLDSLLKQAGAVPYLRMDLIRAEKAEAERDALRAEVERLREALRRIAAGNPASPGNWLADVDMADIARAALASAPPAKPSAVEDPCRCGHPMGRHWFPDGGSCLEKECGCMDFVFAPKPSALDEAIEAWRGLHPGLRAWFCNSAPELPAGTDGTQKQAIDAALALLRAAAVKP